MNFFEYNGIFINLDNVCTVELDNEFRGLFLFTNGTKKEVYFAGYTDPEVADKKAQFIVRFREALNVRKEFSVQ